MTDLDRDWLDHQMRKVETLIEQLARLPDPTAHAAAREVVQTLLAFHQAGLARMLEILRQTDSAAAVAACGSDDLVGRLLLLHGLHPVDLETRVRQALEQVEPLVHQDGGRLELVSVAPERVHVRLAGAAAMSGKALEPILEEAFAAIAPDVEVIEIEAATDPETPSGRMPLPLVATPIGRNAHP